MSLTAILLIIAALIVISLAVYAGNLLSQVATQKKAQTAQLIAQEQLVTNRNEKIAESIRLIAKAIVEQQCEISEGVIRIARLLETFHHIGDRHFPAAYPNLHDLDQRLSQFPTHQGYKDLKRQQRMRFDVQRAQWEDELKQPITQECESLLNFNR
ncbi:MAG: DUF2489 domain-containing protein [Gammaproteobacteria bacterium]|nr:DUF2489 domain-containing protein [Gammaproteobacteria bacterium]